MSRALLLGWLLLVPAGGGSAQAPEACPARKTSRWAGFESYRVTATFGAAGTGWLQDLTGITGTARGEVILYDGARGRLQVLDADLEPHAELGRPGPGPSELAVITLGVPDPHSTHDLVSGSGPEIDVYDGTAFKSFDIRTGAAGHIRRMPTRFGPQGVRHIHRHDGVLYFTHDVIDLARSTRAFQVRALSGDSLTLLYSLQLPLPTPSAGGFYTGPQEARPLWAARAGCAIIGDGSSPWILRLDLATGAVDTVALPHISVPVDATVPPFLRDRLGVGRTAAPTAVWRWVNAVIDPDGHIWLQPWRDPERVGPFTVYHLDPNGEVRSGSTPAFPLEFAGGGAFYARVDDPVTGEITVVRYDPIPGVPGGQRRDRP